MMRIETELVRPEVMSHARRQRIARNNDGDVVHRDALGGQAVIDRLLQRAFEPVCDAVLPARQALLLDGHPDVPVAHQRGGEVVVGAAQS